MQLMALIKKEILLLFKNWPLLLVSIIVPILTVAVSYVTNQTSTINLNIGYIGSEFSDFQIKIINEKLTEFDTVKIELKKYQDSKHLIDDYEEGNIDSYFLNISEGANIRLYYDPSSTKSELASAYFNQAIQIVNSQELYGNHKDIIIEIEKLKVFSLDIVTSSAENNSNKLDSLIVFGFIWIFLYSTLNNSVTQIQQEKTTKTILYLLKAPINPAKILISKQTAVLVQFYMMISCYIVFVSLTGLYNFSINLTQIIAWALVVLCVSSLGYLLGILINNIGVMLIVELVLVFPIMLVDTLQTSILDNIIRFIPTFNAAKIMIASFENASYSYRDIVSCLFAIIVSYIVSIFILVKREAIKLCDTE